jgi:asparagine synthase (glutamine-hydrolysing)
VSTSAGVWTKSARRWQRLGGVSPRPGTVVGLVCGIGGIVGGGPPDIAVLEAMAECMAHRGPDGQATWSDGRAGLTFRRLAIIDLDERSMQPMHYGPWHLVFNGEIYNYRELKAELASLGHSFATEGDGEVLLHAWAEWGEAALDRFDGMFALAIWHDESGELVLASDPFGEKPLYWARDGERIVFASDIGAILNARPDLGAPRLEVIGRFLALGLTPPIGESFVAEVNRLPGAHLLRMRAGSVTVSRYWRPEPIEVPPRYADAVERLRELLLTSIDRRLRADVPIGTSLSGGVDSSAVVALSATLAGDHRRHAFTARFPGFARDEWRYASEVAQAAGVVEHHAVEPTGDDLLAELDAVVSMQEEPFGSTSIYAQWCVMRLAREANVTVLLDGQGADEIFGGYPGTNGWAIRSMGAGAVLRGLASPRDSRDVVMAIGAERAPSRLARAFLRVQATSYVTPDVTAAASDVGVRIARAAMHGDDFGNPLARQLVRQSVYTSLPQLLRYADRNSMAHGREVRLPFLSRAVAEFGLSLPAEFVYRDGVTKAVLRDAVRDLVPASVLERRDKVGFEPPQAQWLEQPNWRSFIGELLLDDAARARELYRRELVEDDVHAGRWRDPAGLWRVVNVELWLRTFGRPNVPAF